MFGLEGRRRKKRETLIWKRKGAKIYRFVRKSAVLNWGGPWAADIEARDQYNEPPNSPHPKVPFFRHIWPNSCPNPEFPNSWL